MEILPAYNYLDQLSATLLHEKADWRTIPVEFNLSGSRLSGKTTSFSITLAKMLCVAMKTGKKIAFYCARKLTKSVPELVTEIKTALEDFNIEYLSSGSSTRSSFPMFMVYGGSFVQVLGVTQNKSSANLKGLAKCHEFDLSVDWVEEANECFKKDFQDLRFAVRGAQHEIHWTSCNPDILYQDHIKYLNDNVPFDMNYLKAYGQMVCLWYKKLQSRKVLCLNHYTNFKVNFHLPQNKLDALEDLLITDPVKAIPWYYGMPGSLSGTVFGEYIPRARKDIDFIVSRYSLGLDLGYSESPTAHPTVLTLVGTNEARTRFHPINEYYHDNLEGRHKTLQEIYLEMISKLVVWIKQYRMRQDTVVIMTDYGSGGLVAIDMLNRMVATMLQGELMPQDRMALQKVIFQPVDKAVWFVKDRVDATQLMLAQGILGLNEQMTPNLIRQMTLMVYKEQRDTQSFKVEVLDLHDDCWDSLCYAIMPDLKNTLATTNPLIKRGAF